MDRQRCEMAHLEYAVLGVCYWYPDHFQVSKLPFKPGSIDATMDAVCAAYHVAFSKKYAGWLLLLIIIVNEIIIEALCTFIYTINAVLLVVRLCSYLMAT